MSSDYLDYADFYERGPYASNLRELRLAGQNAVRLLDIEQPPGEFPDPPIPEVLIGVVSGRAVDGQIDLGSGRWQGRMRHGDIFVSPPMVHSDYAFAGAMNCLAVVLPLATLATGLHEDDRSFDGDFGRLHTAPFQDPLVEGLCRRMWVEAANGGRSGAMFADHAAQTLAATLLCRAERTEMGAPKRRESTLSRNRLKRCLDYLQAHLSEDVGLQELADAAGLSPLYFAKAFKASTGQAPHQYLIARRIELAKELLTGTDQTATEIALACGFYDQSHFSHAFRKAVGVSPSAYRRA